jgi:alkylated DNA nucleotide flippase Atl1
VSLAPGPAALDLTGNGAAGGTIRAKFRPSRAVLASVQKAEAGAPVPRKPRRRARADRLARQLALAHRIERAVESGEVASYGAVARALGLTQPRVTQVMGLLMLSPAVQERVLLGGAGMGIREAARAAREAEWGRQEEGKQ